ncbi:hypothetical protein GE061_010838 [Apolygus lucorum]|uniref:G-protein coupled receptors family 1 profile domain-containing protein n=1 Tax=Apolygus lucorum TaxID=248454 RepID=A0A8S9XW25_APOLU|nr:hypothetical protein GE061_010838 [Apolygus lucorum]
MYTPNYALQFGLVDDGKTGQPLCGLKRILIEHAFEVSTLLFFILPMTLITVLYVLIGLRLRRSSVMTRESGGSFGHTERGHRGQPPHRHHCSRRVLKMLVAVVVAFFICWAPFHAQRLFSIYYDVQPTALVEHIYSVVTYISGVLYYLSTTINPILYHIMSLKFREAFKTTLAKCCFDKRRARPYLILSRGKIEPDSGKSGTDSATALQHEEPVYFRSCSQEISNSSLRRVDRGDLEDELTSYMNELERRQNS